jgi:hypothetical protein
MAQRRHQAKALFISAPVCVAFKKCGMTSWCSIVVRSGLVRYCDKTLVMRTVDRNQIHSSDEIYCGETVAAEVAHLEPSIWAVIMTPRIGDLIHFGKDERQMLYR